MTGPTAVDVDAVRRWIRRTRSAHRERGETIGNLYYAVLLLAVVGSMLAGQLRAVFWPETPGASALAGTSLTLVVPGLLYLALRRLGPLALSRPAASWLLTAPVSRRALLLPALRAAAAGAAVVSALAGLAVVGHTAPRPVPGRAELLVPLSWALGGVAVLLLALAAQGGRRWGSGLDTAAYLVVAAGLGALVVDSAVAAPRFGGAWPSDPVLLGALGVLGALVVGGVRRAVRRLADTPNERILDASRTAGTLADSAFGVEPSFVTDMVERRYWARRRLRSVRFGRRLPVLVGQDLLLARRRGPRLLALAGAVALPALLASAPGWLLAVSVAAGGMIAAGTSTATVRTDAGNPVLLRLLGLSSRRAIAQRLCVPGVLAALWCGAALGLLRWLDVLPPGPWWALGLTLGPVGAVAAVRRARVGFVDNGLLPLDTPMGTISTGPALNSVIGFDALLLGLPAIVQIAGGDPPTWPVVAVQAAVGVLGVAGYLWISTSARRVQLSRR